MDDQENIRQINERNNLEEQKEEKSQEQLTKEHLERLSILHRRARGVKW